jgi:hypothetical protein
MIGIGTALLLSGVLFFFERRFLRDVGTVAGEAGAAAAEEVVAQSTEAINVRLDELSDQMDEMLAEEAQVHDSAIAALSSPTFDTVATALAHANTLGALKNGHVTVQGSDDPDELGLQFSWGMSMSSEPSRISLTVHGVLYEDLKNPPAGGSPLIEIQWSPDESAAEAGIRLRALLVDRGRLKSDATLRWDHALLNLQMALDIAVRSRRRDPGSIHLRGALAELVDRQWMITEGGLECPDHAYVYPEEEFPSQLERMAQREREEWMPSEKPDWVDDALWDRLVQRGKRIFPIRRGPMRAAPTWVPMKKTPTELREDNRP